MGLALYQVGNILFGLSTELGQALVQRRLATSERRRAEAALHSQSSQFKKRAICETKNGLSTQETPHVLLPSQSSWSVLIVHLNHPALFRLPTGLETLQSGIQVSSSLTAGSERAPRGLLPSPSQAQPAWLQNQELMASYTKPFNNTQGPTFLISFKSIKASSRSNSSIALVSKHCLKLTFTQAAASRDPITTRASSKPHPELRNAPFGLRISSSVC